MCAYKFEKILVKIISFRSRCIHKKMGRFVEKSKIVSTITYSAASTHVKVTYQSGILYYFPQEFDHASLSVTCILARSSTNEVLLCLQICYVVKRHKAIYYYFTKTWPSIQSILIDRREFKDRSNLTQIKLISFFRAILWHYLSHSQNKPQAITGLTHVIYSFMLFLT